MTNTTRFWIPLLLLLAAVAEGDSARVINPFDGMTDARVSVVIGGALDSEGGGAMRLFAGDMKRAGRFREVLTQSVAARLKLCGITTDDAGEDEVEIRVFGRPEAHEERSTRYIYLVEAGVYNSTQASAIDDRGFTTLRPIMGMADDQTLETALASAALTIITEQLPNCGVSPTAATPPSSG